MLDAPVTDASREFLDPFKFDPWEAVGSVLPKVLDLAALQMMRPTVQALIQALDLPADETTPLTKQLADIDQRIAQLRPIPTKPAPAAPPPTTRRPAVPPRPVEPEVRPADPSEVLDLLLAFFADGARWIRGRMEDQQGNRCLMGGLQYVQQHHRIDRRSRDEAERSLVRALPRKRGSGISLIAFNDSRIDFAEVRALILKARELTGLPDTGTERRPQRQRQRPQPQSRQWHAPTITEGNPLTEPECASLAKLYAAETIKRRLQAEIELERVARAAKGDFRSTFILCPEPPSNYRMTKVIPPAGDTPKNQSNRGRVFETREG
jgi:hypothetical protein